jgi:hypothetical protein
MAQATGVTTAIRQLMSRGRPPNSPSPRLHTAPFAALPGNTPHSLRSKANSDDLELRVNHLQKVFAAPHVYTAVFADAVQSIAGSALDRRYFDDQFQQFAAEAIGVNRNAAAEMRARENWRVS